MRVLVVAAAFIAALAIAHRCTPAVEPYDLDALVVTKQLARAKALPETDLIIVGDSSGLMGVDALTLQDRLQQHVESPGTFGWVGPAGYGRLLELASARRSIALLD